MQSSVEHLLLHEVQPRLQAAIPHSVPFVGSDDVQELVQDGTVMALGLLQSAARSGKSVSAGNLVFYTLKSLRSGRRSTGERKNDVLHPKAQLTGHSRVCSLDQLVVSENDLEESLTLGESLAAPTEDPAQTASRRLDWEPLLASLNATDREVLASFVKGEHLTELVPKLQRSRSALQGDKHRLAGLLREHLGQDVLSQVQELPRWTDNLTARREKIACRAEHRTA